MCAIATFAKYMKKPELYLFNLMRYRLIYNYTIYCIVIYKGKSAKILIIRDPKNTVTMHFYE